MLVSGIGGPGIALFIGALRGFCSGGYRSITAMRDTDALSSFPNLSSAA